MLPDPCRCDRQPWRRGCRRKREGPARFNIFWGRSRGVNSRRSPEWRWINCNFYGTLLQFIWQWVSPEWTYGDQRWASYFCGLPRTCIFAELINTHRRFLWSNYASACGMSINTVLVCSRAVDETAEEGTTHGHDWISGAIRNAFTLERSDWTTRTTKLPTTNVKWRPPPWGLLM